MKEEHVSISEEPQTCTSTEFEETDVLIEETTVAGTFVSVI